MKGCIKTRIPPLESFLRGEVRRGKKRGKREEKEEKGEREEKRQEERVKKTKGTKNRGMVGKKGKWEAKKKWFCHKDFGKLFKLGFGRFSRSIETI